MYQMATITYHTLHGTQTVVLPEDVTAADGTVYKAGTYEFPVDGRYWTDFDRTNPIEAKAREQAWTGTAHALIAELGVGHRHRLGPADGPRHRRPCSSGSGWSPSSPGPGPRLGRPTPRTIKVGGLALSPTPA